MKKIKTTLAVLMMFTCNLAFSQQALKNPVSFKLKNGLNVLVAQNVGFGKIFARLTIENPNDKSEQVMAQLFENYLASKASRFNDTIVKNVDGTEPAKVSMSFKEMNSATDLANFEQALQYIALPFTNSISDSVFDEMKAQYLGDKKELSKLTLADVQHFYQKSYRPQDSFNNCRRY